MHTLYFFIRILFWISLALLILGLWRPWIVLWWMASQNRLTVIKYYGIALLSLLLLSWLVAAMISPA